VVECWGHADDGRAPATRSAPAGRSYTQLGAGNSHGCALRDDGVVECWGVDFFGQAPATRSAGAGSFVALGVGQYHNCAIRTDGTAECWGWNGWGQAPDVRTSQGITSVFAWSGFYSPVRNLPALNAVQAGRAVPLKFSLGSDEGLDILAAGYPHSVPVNCAAPADATGVPIATSAAGGSGLSYDAAANQYTYVWKTSRLWAGSCRRLVVGLTDGTTHSALFRFR
jgi:hypothetical protein